MFSTAYDNLGGSGGMGALIRKVVDRLAHEWIRRDS